MQIHDCFHDARMLLSDSKFNFIAFLDNWLHTRLMQNLMP